MLLREAKDCVAKLVAVGIVAEVWKNPRRRGQYSPFGVSIKRERGSLLVTDQDQVLDMVRPMCEAHQGGRRLPDAPGRCDLYDAVTYCRFPVP
jgi:hypothetical protein